MRRQMKTWLALIALCSLLFFLPTFSSGQPKEILKFESEDTLEEIRAKIKHNGYSFKVARNWVFDMSPERREKLFSRRTPVFPRVADFHDEIGPLSMHLGKQLPSSFDWRNYNGHSYIGSIRDQGDCGSCYAFGACAAAEGTYNYANGLYDGNCADFSEAYLAFCLSDYYSGFDGCEGADYDYEELTALTVYGVCNEGVYPYQDHEQLCGVSPPPPTVTFESWQRVPCGDVDAIKAAIMTYGVVDAAVMATSAFSAYESDIYEDANISCSSSPCYYTPTNHAIALVGWNDNGDPEKVGYWILRNSWGTSWGEEGYMRIKYTSALVACEVCYLVGPNNAPMPPSISSPQDGAEVATLAPNLEVNNSTDEDLDALTYFFEIDKVNTFDSLSLDQSPEVAEGAGDITSWYPSELTDNTTYYWRAKAYDGTAYSDWSTGSFFVNLSNDAPTTPTINNPGNNSTVTTLTPTLTVNPSTDVDLDQITCDFELYSDSNLSNLVASISGAGTSWQVDVSLTNRANYYWRVRAVDEHGATSEWSSTVSFFVNTTGNAGDDGGRSVFGIDCFTATAAYGFPVAEEVVVLRNFRDNVLLKNSLGRSFVKFYYEISPPLADCIEEHEILRAATRFALTPLVYGIKYLKTSVLIFLSSILAISLTLRVRRSNRF